MVPSFSENNIPVCNESMAWITDKAEMFDLIAIILNTQILMLLPRKKSKAATKNQGKALPNPFSKIGKEITAAVLGQSSNVLF